MAYTYDSATLATNDVHAVRRHIGDTDISEGGTYAQFDDAEIQWQIDEMGSVVEAAIELLEQLAIAYADKANVQTANQQKIDLGAISDKYAKMADRLRDRRGSGGGIVDMATTRIDGYSEDVASDDVDALGTDGNTFDRPYYGNKL